MATKEPASLKNSKCGFVAFAKATVSAVVLLCFLFTLLCGGDRLVTSCNDRVSKSGATYKLGGSSLPRPMMKHHMIQMDRANADTTGPEQQTRRLHQFFSQSGLGAQIGFPFFLDIVLDTFDNVGYAGIARPISTAIDRSQAQTHLCTSSAVARANLATCNNIPGFNALAVAG